MKRMTIYLLLALVITIYLPYRAYTETIEIKPPHGINISNIEFAANGPENIREPAVFSPGDNIIITFDVTDYAIIGLKASIKGGLIITSPNGDIILEEEDTIDYTGPAKKAAKKAVASLSLSKAAPKGEYEITINIQDLLGGKSLKVSENFMVK